MKFTKKVFPNGMTLVTVPMKGNPTATIFIAAKTGSKYETARQSGLSHFLEHMCFKGTVKRPTAKIITTELDAIGAMTNAFTSHEQTAYYAKADKSHFDTILDVISDIYINPQIPKAELEKERGVILQEYKMYLDDLRWRVTDVWMNLLYGDTPAGWNIVGNPETIANLSQKDFLSYHKKQYGAENTVVVVAGNVDEKQVQAKVKKAMANVPAAKPSKKKKVVEKQVKPAIKISYKDSDQTHIILGVRSFAVHDSRNKTMRVLQAVLSGGMSSRLFQKMREELGICYYVYADNDTYTDHGNFMVGAGVDQKRLEVAIAAILGELKLMATELVSPEELKKAKEGMIGKMNLSLESSDDLGRFVLSREVLDMKIESPEEIAKAIKQVTAEEVRDLARELFIDETLNLAIVGKHKNEKELLKLLTFK